MARIRSALHAAMVPGVHGEVADEPALEISEITNRDLIQISGWPENFAAVERRLNEELGIAVPLSFGMAARKGSVSAFKFAPQKLWLTGPFTRRLGQRLAPALGSRLGVVSELGHSQTMLHVRGDAAGELLMRALPVDLDAGVFSPGAFARSAMYNIPVLVHRPGRAQAFDVFAPRSFALSFWRSLQSAALPLGYRID